MTRSCPVCEFKGRHEIWSMDFRVPDEFPLPSRISWFTCDLCGMLYGDGDFNQSTLNDYYTNYYGYGINSAQNIIRLKSDAKNIAEMVSKDALIIDFGGAGDDGKSILVDELNQLGLYNSACIGVNDPIPANCDIIFASHVIEHVYDLPETMKRLCGALKDDGLLIVDGPDSMGILLHWNKPMMDYNTKHINHFMLHSYLDLGRRYKLEAIQVTSYTLDGAPAFQIHFKRFDMAEKSSLRIAIKTGQMLDALRIYEKSQEPINIWGVSDIMWFLMDKVSLNVQNYIDSDPAYVGQTYNGHPIVKRPENVFPILILAQGQRTRLIEYIRSLGLKNQIVEIG